METVFSVRGLSRLILLGFPGIGGHTFVFWVIGIIGVSISGRLEIRRLHGEYNYGQH